MASHDESQKESSEPSAPVHQGQMGAYDNQPNQPIQPQYGGFSGHGGYGGYGGPPYGNQVSPYSQAPIVTQPGVSHNTIILTGQQQQSREPRNWSSGLCACFDDMGICCCVFFCPCTQALMLSSDMGESICVPCCVPGWLIALRAHFRGKENITGSVFDDCCTVTFCGPCVQCQLTREVRYVKMRRS